MIKRALTCAALATAFTFSSNATAQEQAATSAKNDAAPLVCKRGGLKRTYGGTDWIVYGCEDDRSMVIVSAKDSAAMPFVFIVTPVDGEYRLRGEGSGSKEASDAAFAELKALTKADWGKLLAETRPDGLTLD